MKGTKNEEQVQVEDLRGRNGVKTEKLRGWNYPVCENDKVNEI